MRSGVPTACCLVPAGAAVAQEDAQWWRAIDSGGLLGYFFGDGPGTPWQPLSLLSDLPGASCEQTAEYHYVVETDIPAHAEADFNAWYAEEHLPGLAQVAGTVRARRFKRVEGHPRYLACYDLVTPETMESAAWLAVRGTPWSSRVRPLFQNTRRTLYVRSFGHD